MKSTIMFTLIASFIVTASLVLWHYGKKDSAPINNKPNFVIGKETTYVNGPLDVDGCIDYAAALNERMKEGVTRENNANALLWKALGPRADKKTIPLEFFRQMGMESPPSKKGKHFVDYEAYLKRFAFASSEAREETEKQLQAAEERPWTRKEFPSAAAWLKANAKPLSLVIAASQRSHYFSPCVSPVPTKERPLLLSSMAREVHFNRAFARALVARAMLRVGEGANDDAWQDLLAVHRLGRLLGRGPTIIEAITGIAVDSACRRADLVFLERTKPDAKQLAKYLRDLQELPAMPTCGSKFDLGERFVMLDNFMFVIQGSGMDDLEKLSGGAIKASDPNGKALLAANDWSPALKQANSFYDRLAAAAREKDRPTRQDKLQAIEAEFEAEMKAQKTQLTEAPVQAARRVLNGELCQIVRVYVLSLSLPACSKIANADDRAKQTQDNVLVAFALAAYHSDHGRYPKELAELAPKYLPQVPLDLFSGKPLIYRPNEKGYLLYSVGPNGQDDDGRGPDDEPKGDDLSVRMPLAKPGGK